MLIREGEHLRNNQLTWEQDWQRRKRKEGCRKGRNGKEEKPQHRKQEGKEKQNFRIHRNEAENSWKESSEKLSGLEWLLRSARQDAQRYHLKSSPSVDTPLSPDLQGAVR